LGFPPLWTPQKCHVREWEGDYMQVPAAVTLSSYDWTLRIQHECWLPDWWLWVLCDILFPGFQLCDCWFLPCIHAPGEHMTQSLPAFKRKNQDSVPACP
jgi:hypothetical protein